MYAVIETGGKQYRVRPGETFRVEKLEGPVGSEVRLDRVLAVAEEGGELKAGAPYLEGAVVSAEVVEQHRARKVTVFKYRRRKRYRLKRGHRQPYTALRVKEIRLS